jgi:hypothetical protein
VGNDLVVDRTGRSRPPRQGRPTHQAQHGRDAHGGQSPGDALAHAAARRRRGVVDPQGRRLLWAPTLLASVPVAQLAHRPVEGVAVGAQGVAAGLDRNRRAHVVVAGQPPRAIDAALGVAANAAGAGQQPRAEAHGITPRRLMSVGAASMDGRVCGWWLVGVAHGWVSEAGLRGPAPPLMGFATDAARSCTSHGPAGTPTGP